MSLVHLTDIHRNNAAPAGGKKIADVLIDPATGNLQITASRQVIVGPDELMNPLSKAGINYEENLPEKTLYVKGKDALQAATAFNFPAIAVKEIKEALGKSAPAPQETLSPPEKPNDRFKGNTLRNLRNVQQRLRVKPTSQEHNR